MKVALVSDEIAITPERSREFTWHMKQFQPSEFRFAGRKGCDEIAGKVVWHEHGCPITLQPIKGSEPAAKAVDLADEVLEPADIRTANQSMVEWCDTLIAFPNHQFRFRGCHVWSAVRKAYDAEKKILAIWPDGTQRSFDYTPKDGLDNLCDAFMANNPKHKPIKKRGKPGVFVTRILGEVPLDELNEAFFWANVQKPPEPDGCWLWTGKSTGPRRLPGRYGWFESAIPCKYPGYAVDERYDIYGQYELAHRYSYRLHYGPIKPDGQICHHCDVPKCVRPSHLYDGTALTNARDREIRQRRVAAKGEKNGRSKHTAETVSRILDDLMSGMPEAKVAKKYGVDQSNIRAIKIGKIWIHVPRPAGFFKKFGPMVGPTRKYNKLIPCTPACTPT